MREVILKFPLELQAEQTVAELCNSGGQKVGLGVFPRYRDRIFGILPSIRRESSAYPVLNLGGIAEDMNHYLSSLHWGGRFLFLPKLFCY